MALLHLEFYAAGTFQQIEDLAIDLNRIDRRSALEPFAPTSGIGGAPLPKGGIFLTIVYPGRRSPFKKVVEYALAMPTPP